MTRLLILGALTCFAFFSAGCVLQRKMLFHPSHHPVTNSLVPWTIDGQLVGYARTVEQPKNVWLFTHGNAGQAADRSYALPCFSPADSVFILEYPGYGARPGSPKKSSFDAAAQEAYRWLRKNYPQVPVCAAGESIGSGPAAMLSKLDPPPDKVVLVVPFDTLVSVVKDHLPLFPAGLLLADRWDNVKAFKGYQGKLEIYGAVADQIIPVYHARKLAQSVPGAIFHEIPGGHNDWSRTGAVQFRN